MSVVSFSDYVPSPRFDGLPWTQITIDESASEDGPWVLIDTIALATIGGVDVDPRNPARRDFTTDNATRVEGWYRVSFKDAAGNSQPTTPVQDIAPSEINFRPTVGLVARKDLSRTKDQFGNEIGNFSTTTRPTDTQVVAITDDVLTEVADVLGDVVPDEFVDDAKNVAALRVAMQIELDFYADQVRTERSPYPLLKDAYESALARLVTAMGMDVPGGGVSGAIPGTLPHYGFPDPLTRLDETW